jgi:hypothetical protein
MRASRLGLAILGTACALTATTALALDTRHPWFDDRGTLVWTTDARAALGAAAGRRCGVLVVSGTPDDAATRELVSRVIPDPQVGPRLRATCLALALDSRRAEPTIDPLVREALGVSSAVPAVAFLGPDGRWITGFRGPADMSRFLQHLLIAEKSWGARAATGGTAAGGTAVRGDDAHLPPPVRRAVSTAGENPRLSSRVERTAPTSRPAAAPPPAAAAPSAAARDAAAAVDAAAADAARSREARLALDRALALVLAGDRGAALTLLREVKVQAAGLPEALEAERGIDAILTVQDLARLSDPSSVMAETLRRTKRDELRGTRWARLFAS